MKTVWLSKLTPEQKEEMRSSFTGGWFMRQQLTKILNERIDAARKDQRLKESYDSPNWAYKQADLCGYERAMFEILSLIEK